MPDAIPEMFHYLVGSVPNSQDDFADPLRSEKTQQVL
jgi:hypothetical protein